MRDLLPASYDKRAFQKGGVRLEDNEILSEKGTQDRPFQKLLSSDDCPPIVTQLKCVRCKGTGWQDDVYQCKSECERCHGLGIDPVARPSWLWGKDRPGGLSRRNAMNIKQYIELLEVLIDA